MVAPHEAGELMGLGLLGTWRGAYDMTYLKDMQDFKCMIRFGMGTSTYVTPRGFRVGGPLPKFTEYGEPISTGGHRYITHRTRQKRFTNGSEMLGRDIRYSQMGDPRTDMKANGMLFASLTIRCAHQIVDGTVDPNLLPGISGYLCPDGGAFFSTTDGAGANRNGVIGGNDLIGYDPTTGIGFRRATMACIKQIIKFRDPYNLQPLHMQRIAMEKGVTVAFSPDLLDIYQEAWVGSRIGSRADSGPGSVAMSNPALEEGYRITPLCDPFMEDTSEIWVFINDAPVPPMYEDVGRDLEARNFNGSNSEQRFSTDTEAVLAQKEFDIGINPPLYHCRARAA